MYGIHSPGRQVRGLLQSGDMTTAAPIALYDSFDQTAIAALATGERLIIYMVMISNGDSASIITFFDDKNGDGTVDAAEVIFKQSMSANTLAGFEYSRGFGLSRIPKLKASAASANASITVFGEIQK